jgi:hypothetical protein
MSACLSFLGEKIPDTTPTFPAKSNISARAIYLVPKTASRGAEEVIKVSSYIFWVPLAPTI